MLIIIPVYNEKETVTSVIHEVAAHNPHCDIIAVDDGSDDGSFNELKSLAASFVTEVHYLPPNDEVTTVPENKRKQNQPMLHILHCEKNMGYGNALFTGFLFALENFDDEFILTIDCDRQHQPSDIPRFEQHDRKKTIVSASRYLNERAAGIETPHDRKKINSYITGKLIREAYSVLHQNWPLTDAFCGMKRYSRQFLKSFTGFLKQSQLKNSSGGYAFPLVLWIYYLHWLKLNSLSLAASFDEIDVDRIYITDDRSFGEALDFPLRRYRYYLKTIDLARNEIAGL